MASIGAVRCTRRLRPAPVPRRRRAGQRVEGRRTPPTGPAVGDGEAAEAGAPARRATARPRAVRLGGDGRRRAPGAGVRRTGGGRDVARGERRGAARRAAAARRGHHSTTWPTTSSRGGSAPPASSVWWSTCIESDTRTVAQAVRVERGGARASPRAGGAARTAVRGGRHRGVGGGGRPPSTAGTSDRARCRRATWSTGRSWSALADRARST